MASGSIVRTGRVPRIPWKNGAGTTREVVVFPGSSESADFWWRISVADIVEDAAFSTFVGTERKFLMASRGSLTLDVEGRRRTVIQGQPEAFSGENRVSAVVGAGAAVAINLITRRRVCTGALDVRHLDGPVSLNSTAVAVVLLAGTARTRAGETLEPMEFLLCGPGPETLHFNSAVAVMVRVRVQPAIL